MGNQSDSTIDLLNLIGILGFVGVFAGHPIGLLVSLVAFSTALAIQHS